MKHPFGKFFGIFIISLSLNVNAITTISLGCPVRFVGTVVDVDRSESPFTSKSLERLDVTFDVSNSKTQTSLQVLKYGPHKFVVGKQYKVQTRDGFICSIENM